MGHIQPSPLSHQSHQYKNMYVDAIGFSWDEDYTIGDNLGKSVYEDGTDSDGASGGFTLDPEVLEMLNNVNSESSLQDKYKIFKYKVR